MKTTSDVATLLELLEYHRARSRPKMPRFSKGDMTEYPVLREDNRFHDRAVSFLEECLRPRLPDDPYERAAQFALEDLARRTHSTNRSVIR